MATTTRHRHGGSRQTGREQRRHSRTAQARTPSLSRFYRYHAPAITPGDFTFKLELLRPREPALPLDSMVQALTWDDEQSVLTGSITAFRPDLANPGSLPVTRGHLVRCRVQWAGGTYQLWTMRCQAPQIEVETGQVTIMLQDDLALLDAGPRDWWFRKTKHRTFGYTCDEIAAVVARTLGVKIHKAARGTKRFELKMRGTGLAVLQAAYQKERAASGRAFVIRLRNGKLEIVPLARNPLVYVLAEEIQTALITQKAGLKVPTTVLTGRGRVDHGKATRAITYTDYDRRVVRLLGYVHDTHDFGRVDSHADLRARVKRELAKRLRLNDTITVSHQGIPFILRGDGAEIALPAEGYKGDQAFVFCTRATHTVQAATYTTTWDFNTQDPYLGQVASERKKRAVVRRKAARRSVRHR